MNNPYTVKMEAPRLRPGLTIETKCREKYLAAVVKKLIELIGEINADPPAKPE